MKCPICGYGQAIYDDINEWWHCPQCHGSGEVPMTNEEWFCTLSTEEKAKRIINIAVNSDCDYRTIVEWLKEIHHG